MAADPDNNAVQDTEEEVIDEKPRSLIFHLVKQLTKGQDLTRVLIPTFFLEPRSLLEKFSDLWAHPQFVMGLAENKDPVQRMLAVTKWYLSGWHIRPKGAKKPYNPLLGEVFFCYFDHGDSKSYYVAEQVSHHPPVSAIYVENRRKNITLNAQIWTKSKFLGNSAASIPIGECDLHVTNFGDVYSINFPTVYACGLFIGKLRMELGGEQSIVCPQTGLEAKIEFRTKPLIGGDYNRVRGVIKYINKKDSLYKLEGKWDSDIELIHPDGKTELFFSAAKTPIVKKYVAREEDQGEWESRRVWSKVTPALRKGDHDAATAEKTVLEDAQRERAREREEKGIEYKTKYFHLNDEKKWIFNKIKTHPFDPAKEDPDADPPVAVNNVEEDDVTKNPTLRVDASSIGDGKADDDLSSAASPARSMSVVDPPRASPALSPTSVDDTSIGTSAAPHHQ